MDEFGQIGKLEEGVLGQLGYYQGLLVRIIEPFIDHQNGLVSVYLNQFVDLVLDSFL